MEPNVIRQPMMWLRKSPHGGLSLVVAHGEFDDDVDPDTLGTWALDEANRRLAAGYMDARDE